MRALITGGDSGIGRAVAIAFAREGADVAINYLDAEESDADEAVVALVEAEGRTAVKVPGDLTERSVCEDVVARAHEQLGGLDILVNNAGYHLGPRRRRSRRPGPTRSTGCCAPTCTRSAG